MEIKKDARADDEEKSGSNSTNKTHRLSVFGQPFDGNSSNNNFEQRVVNFLPETTKNVSNNTKKLFAGYRPGYYLDYLDDNVTINTTGRGVWSYNNKLISVVDDKVFLDANFLFTLADTSTQRCGGLEVSNGNFFLCDGLNGYIIYPNGGYKNIEESYLRWSASTDVEYGDKRIPTAYNSSTANTYVYTAETYETYDTGIAVTFPVGNAYEATTSLSSINTDDVVVFSTTGTLPAALTAGTWYRVSSFSSAGSNYVLSLETLAGVAINCTDAGTGTHTFTVKRIYTRGIESTSSSEPSWPTTVGSFVQEGDIIWTCRYKDNDMARKWTTSFAYAVGDLVQPTVETSLYYMVTVSDGNGGATEPTWPLAVGESVSLDGVTYECVGYYGGFPSPHVPTPVFMDGYIVLAEANSVDFYSSGVFSNFSWNALDFAAAENFPDRIVALARQANFIVAFGTNSTELFYNAANEEGSPFSRNENYLLQVGLSNLDSIFATEKYTMWVAKNPAGGHSVWSLNGYEAREVSTEAIERWLDSTYNSIRGFAIRSKGHILFVLTSLDETYVYDLEEEVWTRWTVGEDEVGFPLWTTTPYPLESGTDSVVAQNTYGHIFTIYPDVTSDTLVTWDAINSEFTTSTYPIIGKIKWLKQDFGTMRRKFFHKAELIGQINPDIILDSSYIDVSPTLNYYDHDNINPSAYVDTTRVNADPVVRSLVEHSVVDRLYATRLGSSRRRSWEIVIPAAISANLKIEALEIVYSMGRH